MYIKDLSCISPQNTFENDLFANEPIVHSGQKYTALEPKYAELIPNRLLRRMGKSTRMGIGTGLPLLSKWNTDGIIIGTTDGGMTDCHKFLNQIVNYEEGTLTPTSFVQGSPSSLAGALALMSKNTGYNNTHSNKGLSFENCLMDADILLKEGAVKTLLIGNVEEISAGQFNLELSHGHIKKEDISATQLINSKSSGTVHGEGAVMFAVDSNSDNALAEIAAFDTIICPSKVELFEKTNKLLIKKGLDIKDIDTFILGNSGDVNNDFWYQEFQDEFLTTQSVLTYKNIFGESSSASAFATWMAVQVLQGKKPSEMIIQKSSSKTPKYILIYNQYFGEQHSLILVRKGSYEAIN